MQTWELRAEFALRMSRMYGEEVPAYNTLVEVSTEVNKDYLDRLGHDAERLGSIDRVTAERHGAIRVGTPEELSNVARLFAAFGMYPVGFYDLRDAAASSVPVVSTAFRPRDADELALNPFRVFTSMLTIDDPRFFDKELRRELWDFMSQRELFGQELLGLADQAAADGGIEGREAPRLLDLAVESFVLSDSPITESWYRRLENISAVAADIGGVDSTHINHLTPRVLDIDALYQKMEARGITMIDEIQGPPRWEGPDILLRQTSFRALSEKRVFEFDDGTVGPGSLKVRFGEVEQRGIAVTPAGRELYDTMLAEVDKRVAEGGDTSRKPEIALQVWRENLPSTEAGLAQQELGYFTYAVAEETDQAAGLSLEDAVSRGFVERTPIVYEDFLPKSAAGIFQSNLDGDGSRDDTAAAVSFDIHTLSEIVGRQIIEPTDMYRKQQQDSIDQVTQRLGLDPGER
ncbi:2-oxoadipate dioxygenase/decarboxylase [Nesterenkonia ebinurensis]|uniref:2-oxoadipate dioxygenase/decarboxylase n=1 Tax=Nesterenkonia ebinurensis TaxID=2608252 RepID=UPI00123D8846|nr:VOC family protein [Nesterenkonia ebinurensis]